MYMRYIQVYVIDVDRKKKEDFMRHSDRLFENIYIFFCLFLHCFYFQTAEE